jgi:vancomycin permeability regulator SanA
VTPFAWFRWARRIVLAIVGFVVLVVLYVAIHIWWVAREDQHPRSDAIVVLGASQYNGVPSPVFAARLAHAVTLYNEDVSAHIVTVGGKEPGDVYTEAAAGKTYLAAHGVPRAAIVAVQTGRDTLRSLRAVDAEFKVKGWHTAVIVTDPWHCLRSRTMARDLGIKADTSPERTGPAVASRSVEFRYIARETEAYIYYKIFHNDNEHSAGVI